MTEARNRANTLRASFEAAGAQRVEPLILQPAEALLDLYGEDIRARAYVTSDALRGEQMLRPDFTVPVAQMHMAHGAEPARYTYAGEVFRRQEDDLERPSEYLQVGYEVFDRSDLAAADAEVFALISGSVSHLDVRATTGDIGILMSAIQGLKTTQRRKDALMRHVWRPRRFRALMDRFSGQGKVSLSRETLLAQAEPLANLGPLVGKRSHAEIEARMTAHREDAAAHPISSNEIDLIDALLEVREALPFAIAVTAPSVSGVAISISPDSRAAMMSPVPPGNSTNSTSRSSSVKRPSEMARSHGKLKCSGTPPTRTEGLAISQDRREKLEQRPNRLLRQRACHGFLERGALELH